MALSGVLDLHAMERFRLNDKRKEERTVEEDVAADHPTILTLPKISLGLNSLRDSNNMARQIAMHFDKGTTTLSFVYKHGVVVCADSRATGGAYIGSQSVRKIIPINPMLLGTMAGGAADCTYWIRVLSEHCRMYELRNKKRISVAAASKLLSNIMYNYKGMGISLGSMICGWEDVRGPQIFYVDNEGSRFSGNLFSVGSGSTVAYGVLDSFYKYDMTPEEAFDLGQRAIFYAAHRDAHSGGIVRVYTINKDGWKVISQRDHSELWDIYMKHRTQELL